MLDVLTIGSATLDIFVRSNQFKLIKTKEVATGMALCEVYGAKLDVDDIQLATGGGATNTAVSFSRKGLSSASIVELGNDLPAEMILSDLKKESVNTSHVIQEASEKTAISVVLASPEGGRSIVTYRGASKMLDNHDIPWKLFTSDHKPKWLYISSLGGQVELLQKLIHSAKQNHIKLAVNPGQGEIRHHQILGQLCHLIDVLILNQEEAAELFNLPYSQFPKILAAAKNSGCHTILITQGAEGAHILSESKVWFCPPSHHHMIEATGAGDAFGSGFVAGQILGWDLNKSSQLARANSGSVISFVGAKQGLLSLDQFDKITNINDQVVSLDK